MKMYLRAFGSCLLILAASCSKHEERPKPEKTSPSTAVLEPVTKFAAVAVPHEEPSEDVLSKLEFQRYANIEKVGGLPLESTATGKVITIHPKLYEVHKDSCTPDPQAPQGYYECGLTIKLSLSPDGGDPSEQGERIAVKWDPKGEWVLQ